MNQPVKPLCGFNTCINEALENRIYCEIHKFGPDTIRGRKYGELKKCACSECRVWFRSKEYEHCPAHR
jgi:hypothetical protein